jgi:hypothetical protein
MTRLQATNSNNNNDDSPILNSREPQELSRRGKGRATFLGFRNTKDCLSHAERSMLLKQSARPLYPEGGLSPCVIRVFGVGGGGCNAVRLVERMNCQRCGVVGPS